MKKECLRATKGDFEVTICENRPVKDRIYLLGLRFWGDSAAVFGDFAPGQFAEINVLGAGLPNLDGFEDELADKAVRDIILRRPFSFSDVRISSDGSVYGEILYSVTGPATIRMTTLKKGEKLRILGPLGNGFSVPAGKKKAVLIAGGMGFPPILHLSRFLTENCPEIEVTAFAGAKNADQLPFHITACDAGLETELLWDGHIATDDGSAGSEGFVTDCVIDWLKENKSPAQEVMIYSCGPEPMLGVVAKIAEEYSVDCELSMERMMGCGIGLCQSCAVEVKGDGDEGVYKLCCKDGPIFNSKEIIFK